MLKSKEMCINNEKALSLVKNFVRDCKLEHHSLNHLKNKFSSILAGNIPPHTKTDKTIVFDWALMYDKQKDDTRLSWGNDYFDIPIKSIYVGTFDKEILKCEVDFRYTCDRYLRYFGDDIFGVYDLNNEEVFSFEVNDVRKSKLTAVFNFDEVEFMSSIIGIYRRSVEDRCSFEAELVNMLDMMIGLIGNSIYFDIGLDIVGQYNPISIRVSNFGFEGINSGDILPIGNRVSKFIDPIMSAIKQSNSNLYYHDGLSFNSSNQLSNTTMIKTATDLTCKIINNLDKLKTLVGELDKIHKGNKR